MPEHRTPTHSSLRRLYRNPWLVVLIGLIATLLLFLEARKTASTDFRSRFETNSAVRGTRVLHEMDEMLSVMHAMSQFVQRVDALTDDKFAALATPFLLARKDLKGVAWVPAASQAQAGPAVILRRSRRVICYARPVSLIEEMAGLDPDSTPEIRSAMEQARDTGSPAACAWTRGREGNGQSEFIVFFPIYKKGQTPPTSLERKGEIKGFVLGVLNMDMVLSDLFATAQPEGLALEFVDYFDAPLGRTLYSRSTSPEERKHSWAEPFFSVQPPSVQGDVCGP